MPIHVSWDNDAHTAILWAIEGRFTWEEFERAWSQTLAMYDSVDHCVDMIYDARRLHILPSDSITYLRRRFPARHSKCGYIIAVGLDKTVQLLWQTFTALAAPHLKAEFFDTLEAARAFLSAQGDSAESRPGAST